MGIIRRKIKLLGMILFVLSGNLFSIQAQTNVVLPVVDEVGADKMPDTIAPIHAPFDMPQLTKPVFSDYTLSIVEKGAKQKKMVTEAIQAAIDEVNRKGGGTVLIPKGEWNTGRIVLKSNVNLHVSEGAVVYFSGDIKDYLPVVFTRSAGVEGMSTGACIYANGQDHIAVTGKGRLVGPGRDCQLWKQNVGYGSFDQYIAYDKPATERIYDGKEGSKVFLPTFIGPIHCTNVYIEGISLEACVFWNIVPTYCENVIIRGVTVNSVGLPMGDGMDIESCRNVLIEYCTLSTGDDCFTIKSGRGIDGLRVNKPTENIVLRYNLSKIGHGGITCGSETAGMIRDVYAHDCVFEGTDVGIRFKTRRPRGGGGENLYYERIRMKTKATAIHFDMLGSGMYVGSQATRSWMKPNEFTPVYRNINIKDIMIEDASYFLKVTGIPESPARNVTISNVRSKSQKLILADDVNGLVLENAILESPDRTIQISDGRNILFKNVTFKVNGGKIYEKVDGKLSENIYFKDCTPSDISVEIE